MEALEDLLGQIQNCRLCEALPLGIKPVLQVNRHARILIIGHAPGRAAHESGIPFDDASGKRLREWMGMDEQAFYQSGDIAVMPMGFCYPGRGASGDLAPAKACAPQWHEAIRKQLEQIELTLLLGRYAQAYYRDDSLSLTERVKGWDGEDRMIPLPHPSGRNNIWLKQNPWFEQQTLPLLRRRIEQVLKG